jgi:hypothetical protein
MSPNFKCPKCRSSATEPVHITHAKGVRIGSYTTMSGLSHSLAPPEPRSVVLVPTIFAMTFSVWASFLFPTIAQLLDLGWWSDLRVYDQPSLIFGVGTGSIFGFAMAVRRATWNLDEHAVRYKRWKSKRFCQRCGYVYSGRDFSKRQHQLS